MKKSAFHLSLPCYSISKTKEFYVELIGAKLGRHSTQWLDVDLFGNQITFTKSGQFAFNYRSYKFEDIVLPSFHFGVILDEESWQSMYHRLSKESNKTTAASTFLKDKKGEHRSFFIEDPNGFVVEFKCFAGSNQVFAS